MFCRILMIMLGCGWVTASTAIAQEPDTAAGGAFYGQFCVQCHGVDATGNGPMAELFAIDTPDLTGISARNDGIFPIAQVARKIDGRDATLAHGGEMPIFGQFLDRDQAVALRLPSGQPMMVPQALADLVIFLETIQKE